MGQIGAFFDLDKTLLDTSSGQLYVRYLYRRGEMGLAEVLRASWWNVLSRLGMLDMKDLIPRLLASAAGDDDAEMRRLCDRWFAEDVRPHIAEAGQRCVTEHQSQGHVVAIVSASTQYVVQPMAAHLGIGEQYVCTHLESQGGQLTGRVIPPVCYGKGKVIWAERFAAEYGVDLDSSHFYTDSISDLPLLERVAHPVAVNPDVRLARLAARRSWKVLRFY
jgi:HAD superfamily hydrolase (TIGR01490 family)